MSLEQRTWPPNAFNRSSRLDTNLRIWKVLWCSGKPRTNGNQYDQICSKRVSKSCLQQIGTFAIFLSEQIVIFRAVYASYMSPQLPLSGWKSCDDVPQERCLVSTRIDANRCGSATVYHSFGWGSDNDFGGSQGALISYPTPNPLGNETLEMPSSVARHLWCYGLLKLFVHYFLQENLSWKADKLLGQWKTTATSPQQVAFKKGQAVNMVMATANRSSQDLACQGWKTLDRPLKWGVTQTQGGLSFHMLMHFVGWSATADLENTWQYH